MEMECLTVSKIARVKFLFASLDGGMDREIQQFLQHIAFWWDNRINV
jgi:hypothetical protein